MHYTYGEGFAPLQVAVNNGAGGESVYHVHADHLDTPKLLTDEVGTVVWRARHQGYGEAAVDEDPDGDGTSVTFNIRFPGQYFDAESNLYYNRFRYYDPGVGRYISADPIGQAGGVNVYGYVANNPIGLIDPLGLAFADCFTANFAFAFNSTAGFFFSGPTRLARTGAGMITGGAIASRTGGLTLGQMVGAFARNGVGGLATLGTGGTVSAFVIGSALNAGASTFALGIGIGIGSTADALGQTLAGNCSPPGSGTGSCDGDSDGGSDSNGDGG